MKLSSKAFIAVRRMDLGSAAQPCLLSVWHGVTWCHVTVWEIHSETVKQIFSRSVNLFNTQVYKMWRGVKVSQAGLKKHFWLLSPRAQRDTNVCTCPVPFASLVIRNISVSKHHRMGSTCTTKEQKERIGAVPATATFDFSRVISALSLEVPRHPLASRLGSRLEDLPRPGREEATESVPERYRRDFRWHFLERQTMSWLLFQWIFADGGDVSPKLTQNIWGLSVQSDE